MRNNYQQHQYIDRQTAQVKTETLCGDRFISAIFSDSRENPTAAYKALTSARMSSLLGFINYDLALEARLMGQQDFCRKLNIDLFECVEPPWSLDNPRKIFERKIRYWENRVMPDDERAIVSPADARMLVGSFRENSLVFLKEKFFHFDELFSNHKTSWINAFAGGDYAIFRLTPDKYHYNHVPVSGKVLDFYQLTGAYYPCNPSVLSAIEAPVSKNKRAVTIIDTDVANGTQSGLVAMIEVAALMIGDIVQCYSQTQYENPQAMSAGLFLKRGQPKSLFRPGSSTVVLIFQKNRIAFALDIVMNMCRGDIQSRFSQQFDRPLVETDVKVRSQIGTVL